MTSAGPAGGSNRSAMPLHEVLERVCDRESFLDFAHALVRDREDAVEKERANPTEHLGICPDRGGWYNFSIESYLEAALA